MEDTFNVNAIILDKISYKEKDVKLTVFASKFGKIDLIARGAKNIKSKIAGHVEPLIFAKIMVVRGKRVNYAGSVLGQIFYSNIKNDLLKLVLAGRAIKLVNDLSREGEADSNSTSFLVLKNYLDFLELNNSLKLDILHDVFVLKFIASIGLRPNLGLPGSKSNIFDLESGSLSSQASGPNKLSLSDDCLDLLRLILRSELEALHEIKTEQRLSKEISRFVDYFLRFNVPGAQS